MTVLGDLAAILISGNELYSYAIGRIQPVVSSPTDKQSVHCPWTVDGLLVICAMKRLTSIGQSETSQF
jgi:hypothetical protein